MIDADQILAESFVQHVQWLDAVDSTNTAALEMAGQVPRLPWLVGAEQQTRGRGRNQRAWWAGTGGLTFSLLIRPQDAGVPVSHWPRLSLTTGLAVCSAIQPFLPGQQVQVKWPNDVYVNGQKICGVLLEAVPEHPELLVVGIGLNVNNSLSAAPEELQQRATSMVDLAKTPFDRTRVLIACLRSFAVELSALGRNDPALVHRCREQSFLTGRLVTVRDFQADVSGMCLGIDDDGALRIMTDSGPRRMLTGEVVQID